MSKKVDKTSVAKKKSVSVSDYEKLGRVIESVFASNYISRTRLYWISFSRGLFAGLGIALGSTFILALVLWFLTQFTELPVIGDLAQTIKDSIAD